jgi:hypothetical protein
MFPQGADAPGARPDVPQAAGCLLHQAFWPSHLRAHVQGLLHGGLVLEGETLRLAPRGS